jgi:hypothetical protein
MLYAAMVRTTPMHSNRERAKSKKAQHKKGRKKREAKKKGVISHKSIAEQPIGSSSDSAYIGGRRLLSALPALMGEEASDCADGWLRVP